MNFRDFKNKYEHKEVREYPNESEENPLVSVCVITYQHISYIKKCLDGILMQQTNFPFEIILGDDHSTDGTREICLDYAKKHPEKIRLFLHHRENVIKYYGFPNGKFNFLYGFGVARGKYLAPCEGDDCWTDPLKLQKQVDVLEANPDLAMCTHEVHKHIDNYFTQFQSKDIFSVLTRKIKRSGSIFYRDTQLYGIKAWPSLTWDFFFNRRKFQFRKRTADSYPRKQISHLKDFIGGTWYMHFCTIVAKREIINRFFECYATNDGGHQLTLLIGAMNGGIFHIPEIMAVKNDQPTSITRNSERKKRIKIIESDVATSNTIKRYQCLLPHATPDQKDILNQMIADYSKKIELRSKQ